MNLITFVIMVAPMVLVICLTITFFNLQPETVTAIIPRDGNPH